MFPCCALCAQAAGKVEEGVALKLEDGLGEKKGGEGSTKRGGGIFPSAADTDEGSFHGELVSSYFIGGGGCFGRNPYHPSLVEYDESSDDVSRISLVVETKFGKVPFALVASDDGVVLERPEKDAAPSEAKSGDKLSSVSFEKKSDKAFEALTAFDSLNDVEVFLKRLAEGEVVSLTFEFSRQNYPDECSCCGFASLHSEGEDGSTLVGCDCCPRDYCLRCVKSFLFSAEDLDRNVKDVIDPSSRPDAPFVCPKCEPTKEVGRRQALLLSLSERTKIPDSMDHEEVVKALGDDLNDHENELNLAESWLEGGKSLKALEEDLKKELEEHEFLTDSELSARVEAEVSETLQQWQRHYDLLALDHPAKQELWETITGRDVRDFYGDLDLESVDSKAEKPDDVKAAEEEVRVCHCFPSLRNQSSSLLLLTS